MAPLVLEGATLGQRHKHYNQLLKDATTDGKAEPAKIDYNKTDIENLLNIDIACNNRDVDYIIGVLKGQDTLYLSRAIKRSNWLFTEAQYAHIINPEYLHSTLFPQMMPKATCKLLLQVRLTLKDESRVEKFFQYFKEKDLETALKWLPNCPIGVIEDIVEKHTSKISSDLFGRLCKRSPKVLEIFANATQGSYHHGYLQAAMFLLRSDTDLYLDALEKTDMSSTFNKKNTEFLMKRCPQRIIDNFAKYRYCINIEIFAKYLKAENIKSFILKQLENEELKSFNQFFICDFIKYMPNEEKYEFVKEFINKKLEAKGGVYSKIYHWYVHVPFNIAFPELKKLMRKEPNERHNILRILVINAGKNTSDLRTLLQYFRETYMNETPYFKSTFIHNLLRETDTHLYDRKTWAILDAIFRNMDVYTESHDNDQMCVKAIIGYKITHNKPVPAVIGQKLRIEYLHPCEWKLKGAEREKLFNYIFSLFLSKLNKLSITSQAELDGYVKFLKRGLILLRYWNRELVDYPILIIKIRNCAKIMKEKGWKSPLYMSLYDIMKKPSREAIFDDSLVLFPCQKVCMKALKHDPELLVRHKNEVDALCCNDAVRMDKVLDKIRVYWPQTIAQEWKAEYRARLDKPGEHKSLIRGLCCLLNQHEFLEFLEEFKPQKTKMELTDIDDLSLRKNIAQNMHVARPQVTPDTILRFAEGDYTQFTQHSLNSVMLKLRSIDEQDCIQNFLKGEAILQKHGIHLAVAKLSTAEAIKILGDFWKTSKDPTVRAVLFHNTHKLLCKEKDELLIADLWELMQTFIDSLTAEENKAVYYTFGKLANVHHSIKAAFFTKSYRFLKSLPPKHASKKLLKQLKAQMSSFTEQLDSDLVTSIIEEFVDKTIIKYKIDHQHSYDMRILTTHLLSADNGKIQTERFNKVFVPLLDKLLPLWDDCNATDDINYFDDIHDMYDFDDMFDSDDMYDSDDSDDMFDLDDICDSDDSDDQNYLVKHNFDHIIQHLLRSTKDSLQNNKAKPSLLYRNILKKLTRTLPTTSNIVLFMQLKLAAAFIDILDKTKSNTKQNLTDASWKQMRDIYYNSIPDIAKVVIKYVKEDINEYGPLFFKPVAEAFKYVFDHIGTDNTALLKCLRCMLREKDFIPICLLVIAVLPEYWVRLLKEETKLDMGENDQTKIAKEIHKILISHPAPVVQLNYKLKIANDE